MFSTTDPYGPMSGRNLVLEKMEEEGEEVASYYPPQQTYQSYCDLHHTRHRSGLSLNYLNSILHFSSVIRQEIKLLVREGVCDLQIDIKIYSKIAGS